MDWLQNINKLSELLKNLSVKDARQKELGYENGFKLWSDMGLACKNLEKCVYFVGNGASASMASHFSADLAKQIGVRSSVFTDLSLLTALANDISFEMAYAEALRLNMRKGDMLIAISSSGNSTNIVNAINVARELNGTVVTISAMDENNAIRRLGDLNFYIVASTYGFAETGHTVILHYWIDMLHQAEQK